MKFNLFLILLGMVMINGYDDLSENKNTGQTETATSCLLIGSTQCDAKNAVDRNISTCMRTEGIGARDKYRSTLWYVDLGDIHSIHSIRIQFRDYGPQYVMRQKGRFAGFSLYVSNTTNKETGSRCYKDGPDLPPLDFNTACVTHGRFVIYYNERLDGISYPEGYETVASVFTELCEVTVSGCKNSGVFGYNCDLLCPDNCQEHRCDIINGTCLGCTAGWFGDFCNISCVAGYYGLECGTPCVGHCRDNKPCNHITGECDEGCASGWTGSDCSKQCPLETYGPGCMYSCSGHCINSVPCNRTTGSCDMGCKPGYTGELCDEECSVGFYGLNCSEECSDLCRHGKNHCNHEDGHCEQGCQDGFQGSKCDKICNEGWYGENCSLSCNRNCVNQSCHHIRGNCSLGCKSGWFGLKCNNACLGGTYGKGCIHHCSGHCFNDMMCNPINGSCTEGCAPGYLGNLCDKFCVKGSYGTECAQNCSNKCSDVCNHVDGSCTCSKGWMGSPYCSNECPSENYGLNCGDKCSEHCINKTCDKYNGTCSYGCKESYGGPKCDQSSLKQSKEEDRVEPVAVGGAIGSVILLVIIVTAGILLIRWKRSKTETPNEETEINTFTSVDEPLTKDAKIQDLEMNGIENPVMNLSTNGQRRKANIEKSLAVTDLCRIIPVLSENENVKIKEEYRSIPSGELHSCDEGKKPENAAKNRYKTIYPYDHSRVVLKGSQKESDYINANYIEDVDEEKSYIATQGPKSKTIVDFWKMVWGEDVSVMICLTNIKEGEKKKCAQYWPSSNDKIKNGEISVRNQEETVFADYIIRHFRLQNSSDKTEREAFMFHYTQWPDHDVPEPLSLVIFHRHVMKISVEHPGKYTLVHCSAGIGRTGTYIALDALYKEGERTGKVNVPKYVESMRKDRMNMIQGEDQYKVVYMALLESFRGKSRAISTETFLQKFQEHSCYINLGEVANKSPLFLEYEELLSIRKEYTLNDYKSGRSYVSANYSPTVLPVERYMCPLTNTKGKNVYYNAVSIQSFTKSDHIISAQYPLTDYTEDFLRLVKGYYTPIIVSLCPLVEIESSSLWLPSKNENKMIGAFIVKMTDCTQTATITKTNITVQQKGTSSTRVSVLECRKWKGENDSSNRRALIDLIKEAKVEEKTHPVGRILVLSSDGAKRCGPFCVVFNALEQMTMTREVDIFTITRQLQIRRPEFISSLEEYQFCYDTIADYLESDTVYANC